MLVLFNSHKKQIHTFKTYDALFHHLENMEKVKKRPKRIFAHHSWQRVMSFYRYVRNRKLAPYAIAFEHGLEQALRHAAGTARDEAQKYGLDILEIVSGDVQNPRLIPITPNIDVEALRKRWCEDYCKAHGYTLVEVFSPADLKPFEKKIGGKDGDAHK